jgi:hypothetical protein
MGLSAIRPPVLRLVPCPVETDGVDDDRKALEELLAALEKAAPRLPYGMIRNLALRLSDLIRRSLR